MTKTELEAVITELNRTTKIITEMISFQPNHSFCWAYDDVRTAIIESFFEAYADDLAEFPETKTMLISR
jgi:hypothetical protein